MFRALLLDFDDTLANSYPGRYSAIRQAVRRHSSREITPEEVTQAVLQYSNIEEMMEYLAPEHGLGPKLVRSFREYYYGDRREPAHLFPGVREALDELVAHEVTLGLVTSRYRHQEQEGLRWGVTQELQTLGIGPFFRAVVGYEDTQDHKPHPAPLLKALDLLGIQPRDALAVGDSPLDIQAARHAGIPSAAALWGALHRDALLAAGPDIILEQPHELVPLILKGGRPQ
ncbi:MAG TPA: HAD family hydrolase [Dehalococcoidia bacterium]|nr:HAD family hydrolase [Dehalococcoidia bacterium]